MDFLLISLGLVFIILGIIGSFLPVLPGPITGWIGLLILHQTSIELDGNLFLFATLVISILVFLIDYIIPALGAKKFGGTKWGMWGSTIGLIIGLLFLGPLGVLIGAFLGAFLGELISKPKESENALKAAFGAFIGFLSGAFLKFSVSLVFLYYYFKIVFSNLDQIT